MNSFWEARKVTLPVVGLVAAALIATSGTALADETTSPTAEVTTTQDVVGALADAGVRTGSSVPTTADANSATTAVLGETVIDVPRDGSEPTLVTTENGTVGFGIPGASDATAQRVGSDAAAFVADDGSAQVANVTGTPQLPALQFLTTIPGPDAAQEYRYDVDLPSGTSLQLTDAQSLSIVDGSGAVLAMAPAPWLKDANGVEIEGGASYRLDGETVVLEVDVDRVEAFPATADPFWFLAPAAAWAILRTVLWRCGTRAAEEVASSLLFGRRSLDELTSAAVEGCVWAQVPPLLRKMVRRR